MVANEFIDRYMAVANGEYVKVYLYLLRHDGREITVGEIADALNHTESDVKRAIAYWVRLGVLEDADAQARSEMSDWMVMGRQDSGCAAASPKGHASVSGNRTGFEGQEMSSATVSSTTAPSVQTQERRHYTPAQVGALADKEEFPQLLYIAQKYMNKVFTPRDCQVFAYLYEGLSMSSELLEYLVEYCVQNGHISVRYMETVAMSWHEKGIRTALEAKDYSASYNRDSFAVMKAFGINNRKPAAPEQKLMDKWFRDYGFSREVVLEACSRTITAIHNPSFQYADKILSDWQKAGVRGLADIKDLDAKRTAAREESGESREKRLQKYDSGVSSARQGSGARKNSSNQFHNFKQRDTDYDALVLKQVKP